MGYLYFGSGHGVQENQHRNQGACQDAVLDFPEAEQESIIKVPLLGRVGSAMLGTEYSS